MKNLFTKNIWQETPDSIMGTYKKENRLWVEVLGGILVMVGLWGLMYLALLSL